jgi:hypothetical protein
MTEIHPQLPSDPSDGDKWVCPSCGVSYEFVVLNDGLPGEWVETTSPSTGSAESASRAARQRTDAYPSNAFDEQTTTSMS